MKNYELRQYFKINHDHWNCFCPRAWNDLALCVRLERTKHAGRFSCTGERIHLGAYEAFVFPYVSVCALYESGTEAGISLYHIRAVLWNSRGNLSHSGVLLHLQRHSWEKCNGTGYCNLYSQCPVRLPDRVPAHALMPFPYLYLPAYDNRYPVTPMFCSLHVFTTSYWTVPKFLRKSEIFAKIS